MATMTQRDKRTIRVAAIGIVIYLVLFYGLQLTKKLEKSRSEYQQLEIDIQRMQGDFQTYEAKITRLEKLMADLRINPSQLSKTSLVAEASAAIQKLALSSGIQTGPTRESPPRPSNKELATIQLESIGPIPALTRMLSEIQQLGYPLILDSVQITIDPTKPGMMKANFNIILLDYEQWKKEERRNA